MHSGVIFDIKEFSVHDGPGVRQTVFLKGCPLRCVWCHNPEGWEVAPQLLVNPKLCVSCGACKDVCTRESCTACGTCLTACPVRARWICGEALTSEALASRIRKNAEDYRLMAGGVTFSGGEPLMQPAFLFETVSALPDIHKVLETSGYASPEVFQKAMDLFDLIYMDFKLADPRMHLRYTGRDNGPILANIRTLCAGDTPFVIRIPLIPGVTDTEENITEIARQLQNAKMLQYVEFLPYNPMAGAKYPWLRLPYAPDFSQRQKPVMHHDIMARFGIESRGR